LPIGHDKSKLNSSACSSPTRANRMDPITASSGPNRGRTCGICRVQPILRSSDDEVSASSPAPSTTIIRQSIIFIRPAARSAEKIRASWTAVTPRHGIPSCRNLLPRVLRRKGLEMKRQTIRISSDLASQAQHSSQGSSISRNDQLERWIRTGRAIERIPDFGAHRVESTLRGQLNPSELDRFERAVYEAQFEALLNRVSDDQKLYYQHLREHAAKL